MLTAISPIDGRYIAKTKDLTNYFSEHALIKYRVIVEMEYFKYLVEKKVGILSQFPTDKIKALDAIVDSYSIENSQKIKDIEKITNHDVKAVEYFIKEEFDKIGNIEIYKEFIHFGLTSQDINNTSLPPLIFSFIGPLVEIRSIVFDPAKICFHGTQKVKHH